MIIANLLFSPMVFAQSSDDASKRESNWQTAANATVMLTDTLNKATQSYLAAKQGNGSQKYAALADKLTLKPIDPGKVSPVFAGCLVYPAAGADLSYDLTCSGAGQQEIMNGYGDVIIATAEKNKQLLKNLLVYGHEENQSQGLTCYKNNIKNFELSLKNREKMLSDYLIAIEKDFQLLTDPNNTGVDQLDLTMRDIKKQSALLTGKNVGEFFPDGNFGKMFIGTEKNSICGTVLSSVEFNQTGKSKGLRGIQDQMQKTASNGEGSGANRTLSAVELSEQSTITQIQNDIKAYSTSLSSSLKSSRKIGIAANSVSPVIKLLSPDSKALKNKVDQFNKEMVAEREKLESSTAIREIKKLKNEQTNILTKFVDGDIDLSALNEELLNEENNSKISCLKETIISNAGSLDNFARKFKNPTVAYSKDDISDQTDNGLANAISDIFKSAKSVEEIQTKILAFETSKPIFQSYLLEPGKSFTVNGKTYNASDSMNASSFYSIFIDNCKRKFANNKASGSLTKLQAKTNISTFAAGYDKLVSTAPAKLSAKITGDLLNCSEDKMTGVSPLSCSKSSGAMNLDSTNFCLRTASTCANNINSCLAKAEDEVKKVVTARKAQVDTVNTIAINFKQKMKTLFETINKNMANQAASLDQQVQMGTLFALPNDEFNLTENHFFKDLDEDIKVHDPKKYLEIAKKKVNALIEKAKEQRIAFVGPESNGIKDVSQSGTLGQTAQKYLDNYQSGIASWDKLIAECRNVQSQVDKSIADQNKLNAENNALIADACMELAAFNEGGDVEANELRKDLTKAVALAASQSQASQSLSPKDRQEIAKIRSCDGKAKGSMSIRKFCSDDQVLQDFKYQCQIYNQKICKAKVGEEMPIKGSDCYLADESSERDDAIEDLKAAMEGYECNKMMSNLGEVKVSVCDASGLSGVNSKGLDVLSDTLQAIGQNQAIRENR